MWTNDSFVTVFQRLLPHSLSQRSWQSSRLPQCFGNNLTLLYGYLLARLPVVARNFDSTHAWLIFGTYISSKRAKKTKILRLLTRQFILKFVLALSDVFFPTHTQVYCNGRGEEEKKPNNWSVTSQNLFFRCQISEQLSNFPWVILWAWYSNIRKWRSQWNASWSSLGHFS